MWKKTAVAVASALMIGGSAMVYAQQGGGESPGMGGGFGGHGRMGLGERHLTADDLRAFTDARIAALHAGLELNADQEKNWPPVEQALREVAKMRMDRLAARREGRDEQPSGNPIERLQRRADQLTATGTALKHLADAAAPLYQSLDDAQKHRLTMLARLLRPHRGMERGHGMMERGHGMMGRDRMNGRGDDDFRGYHDYHGFRGGDEFRRYPDDRRMPGDGTRGGGTTGPEDDSGRL